MQKFGSGLRYIEKKQTSVTRLTGVAATDFFSSGSPNRAPESSSGKKSNPVNWSFLREVDSAIQLCTKRSLQNAGDKEVV